MAKTYADKLKDPRWQKKRLEILQRDKWACCHCKSTTNTLHIHHRTYKKGRSPWEYENYSLITLCEDCHKSEPEDHEEQMSSIISILRSYTSVELRSLTDALVHMFYFTELYDHTSVGLFNGLEMITNSEPFLDNLITLSEKKNNG